MSGHLVVFEFYKVKDTILLLSKRYWDLYVDGDVPIISALVRLRRQEGAEVQTSLGYVLRLCLQTNTIVGMS